MSNKNTFNTFSPRYNPQHGRTTSDFIFYHNKQNDWQTSYQRQYSPNMQYNSKVTDSDRYQTLNYKLSPKGTDTQRFQKIEKCVNDNNNLEFLGYSQEYCKQISQKQTEGYSTTLIKHSQKKHYLEHHYLEKDVERLRSYSDNIGKQGKKQGPVHRNQGTKEIPFDESYKLSKKFKPKERMDNLQNLINQKSSPQGFLKEETSGKKFNMGNNKESNYSERVILPIEGTGNTPKFNGERRKVKMINHKSPELFDASLNLKGKHIVDQEKAYKYGFGCNSPIHREFDPGNFLKQKNNSAVQRTVQINLALSPDSHKQKIDQLLKEERNKEETSTKHNYEQILSSQGMGNILEKSQYQKPNYLMKNRSLSPFNTTYRSSQVKQILKEDFVSSPRQQNLVENIYEREIFPTDKGSRYKYTSSIPPEEYEESQQKYDRINFIPKVNINVLKIPQKNVSKSPLGKKQVSPKKFKSHINSQQRLENANKKLKASNVDLQKKLEEQQQYTVELVKQIKRGSGQYDDYQTQYTTYSNNNNTPRQVMISNNNSQVGEQGSPFCLTPKSLFNSKKNEKQGPIGYQFPENLNKSEKIKKTQEFNNMNDSEKLTQSQKYFDNSITKYGHKFKQIKSTKKSKFTKQEIKA